MQIIEDTSWQHRWRHVWGFTVGREHSAQQNSASLPQWQDHLSCHNQESNLSCISVRFVCVIHYFFSLPFLSKCHCPGYMNSCSTIYCLYSGAVNQAFNSWKHQMLPRSSPQRDYSRQIQTLHQRTYSPTTVYVILWEEILVLADNKFYNTAPQDLIYESLICEIHVSIIAQNIHLLQSFATLTLRNGAHMNMWNMLSLWQDGGYLTTSVYYQEGANLYIKIINSLDKIQGWDNGHQMTI